MSHPACARFAVVVNPGTIFQAVEAYALTMREAVQWADSLRDDEECVDVMRILPSGDLTTEF